MGKQRYEKFQNELEGCTDKELERFERIFMERRGRATASVTMAPIEDAPARSTSIGMFMPSTIPELMGGKKWEHFSEEISNMGLSKPV